MNRNNFFIHKCFSFMMIIIILLSITCHQAQICTYAEPDTEPTSETSEQTQTAETAAQTADWPAYPEIFAETGVLIEASTGTVLYDKNCHQQMYPASITKIMTTLLALENGNLDDMVEYYHYDVYSLEYGDANIARQEGELLSLRDTLYAVMLASANECANAAGEYVARKTSAFTDRISELQASGEDFDEGRVAISVFADMMNERAAQAGALGTHFSNPNGLFSEDHYTTAYDMAMITREAIKNDEFLKIESDTSYLIPTTNKNPETQMVYQRHKMVYPTHSAYYEGVLGGKTGYVDQSGSTLVTFAKKNGMTLICVVMRSNGTNVYNDTRILLDYGFDNFSLSNVSENETKFSLNGLGSLSNLDSVFDTDSALIELNKDGNVVLPNGVALSDCVSELTFNDGSSQTSSDSIAKIDYYYNDIKVGGTDLLLNKSDVSFTFGPAKEVPETKPATSKKDNYININIWFLLGGIFIVLIIVAVIYYSRTLQNWSRLRRRKRRKSMRNRSSLTYGGRRRRRRH